MYRKNTVFVVGAGASAEFGLPMGSELANRIAGLMRFEFEAGQRRSGDNKLYDSWRYRFRDNNELNYHLRAARRISDGISLANSIDMYLHIHAEDNEAIFCGKSAIVRAILESESGSRLYVDPRNTRNTINFDNTSDTWIKRFFNKLIDGVQKKDINNIFDNISIICFNYDRCIEHFLVHAIAQAYSIERAEAYSLVEKLKIYHPYGTIGPLRSPERMGDGLTFGDDFRTSDIDKYVNRIKTFTEQVDDQTILKNIKNTIFNADNVIFLGFAYHKQNIELITPEKKGKIKSIFGTAFGISDHGRKEIEIIVKNLSSHIIDDIIINNDLKCAAFLDHYQISF